MMSAHSLGPSPGSGPPNPASFNPNNKRSRPTISCLECRRKKLKCDRERPCGQCRKVGRETLCAYVSSDFPKTTEGVLIRARDVHYNYLILTNMFSNFKASAPAPISISQSNGAASRVDESRKRQRVEAGGSSNRPEQWNNSRDNDNAISWLTGPSNYPAFDDGQSENRPARMPERVMSLGKIYVKKDKSRYCSHSARMVMLDHVGDFLLYDQSLHQRGDTLFSTNDCSSRTPDRSLYTALETPTYAL